MVQMHGNDVIRDYQKIGGISGNDILDHTGKKLGYVVGNDIFDAAGKKVASVEGEFVYTPGSSDKRRIEDEIKGVNTPNLSNVIRVAIKCFLGD